MTSTYPLSPHVEDEWDRRVLGHVLLLSRRSILTMAARRNHWARGYHVRVYAEALLCKAIRQDGDPELTAICYRLLAVIRTAPLWRGYAVTAYEAKELATDGPIQN